MAKHSSGLRNRHRRRGRSAYSRLGKSRDADFYGKWQGGRLIVPEKIRRRDGES